MRGNVRRLVALYALAAGLCFVQVAQSHDLPPPGVPPATGYYAARLIGPSEISPRVHIQILPGARPGLYLENRSPRPITVLDARGKPVLTIGLEGVHVNGSSGWWHTSIGGESVHSQEDPPAQWEQRSPVPRFSWIEPRLGVPADPPLGGGERRVVRRWNIDFIHGTTRGTAAGVIEWIPLPASGSDRRRSRP